MRNKFERLADKNILEVIKDLDMRPLERLKLGHCWDKRRNGAAIRIWQDAVFLLLQGLPFLA